MSKEMIIEWYQQEATPECWPLKDMQQLWVLTILALDSLKNLANKKDVHMLLFGPQS